MDVPSRHLIAVLGCSCIALASCGGDEPGPSARQPETAPPSATTDTRGGVQLEDVDGRLGGAVTADATDTDEQILEKGGPIPDDLAEPPSDDTGVGAGGACPDPELVPAADNLPRIGAATLCLMNAQRRKHGLPPLTTDAILARASRGHSADMVKRSYFAHNSPEGRTVVDRLRSARYIPKGRGWTVGENLAWGSGPLGSPRAIVQAWLDSPGHRKNLLSPRYSAVGLGIVHGNPQDPGNGATFTTAFGRRG
jgi:uncharacterized protein YkwD